MAPQHSSILLSIWLILSSIAMSTAQQTMPMSNSTTNMANTANEIAMPMDMGDMSTSGSGSTTTVRSSEYPPLLTDPCVTSPQSSSDCKDYTMPDTIANSRIQQLCDAMPFMVGCTLNAKCTTAGTATGPYCSPFSILADICYEMPKMKGCEEYNTMCVQGSQISQCSSPGMIPNGLKTIDTAQSIVSLCKTHSMVGCDECTSSTMWSNCPDPLSTMSKLCISMPDMAECKGFTNMCAQQDVATTFSQLCGTSSSSDTLPPMKMWLHASTSDIILFKEWVPTNFGTYIASCLAVIAMAVLVQYLKGLRVQSEVTWAARQRLTCCSPVCSVPKIMATDTDAAVNSGKTMAFNNNDRMHEGCCSPTCGCADVEQAVAAAQKTTTSNVPVVQSCDSKFSPERSVLCRNAIRSVFTFIIVFMDYMLMLIVMTFNIGLIICAVLGFAIGALLFGHMGETAGTNRTSRGGSGAVTTTMSNGVSDPVGDAEVHFVDPQTCCNGRTL